MKRPFKIGAASVFAAGIVIGGGAYLSNHWAAETITERLAKATGLQAHFAKTDLGFWPKPHFTGYGLRLTDADPSHDAVFAVEQVRFDLSWAGLFASRPVIGNMVLSGPHLNMVEDETRKQIAFAADADIYGITIENGSATLHNNRRNATASAQAIDLRITATDHGSLALSGKGQVIGHTIGFEAEAASVKDLLAGTPTDLNAAFDIKDAGTVPFSMQSKIQLTDHALLFQSAPRQLAATDTKINGSFDWSRDVPNLSLTVLCDELTIEPARLIGLSGGAFRDGPQPTGAAPIDVNPSRLIDVSLDVALTTLRAGTVKASSLRAKTTLSDGLLKAALQSSRFYQGTLQANLAVDGKGNLPSESLDMTLSNVNAAPLLSDLASFHHLDGTLDMTLTVTTSGADPQVMASTLAGASTLRFHDGAVSGIDVPSALRSVLAYMPPNWRSLSNRIAITSVDGAFTINQGTATTKDLHILSPIIDVRGKGNIDLANQSFDLRFDPKIVAQTAKATQAGKQPQTPLDLGTAILVQGAWANPRISADLGGLLNDPNAAAEKLGTLGQQLLGSSGNGSQSSNEDIMQGVGDLLGGLLGGTRKQPAPPPAAGRRGGGL